MRKPSNGSDPWAGTRTLRSLGTAFSFGVVKSLPTMLMQFPRPHTFPRPSDALSPGRINRAEKTIDRNFLEQGLSELCASGNAVSPCVSGAILQAVLVLSAIIFAFSFSWLSS